MSARTGELGADLYLSTELADNHRINKVVSLQLSVVSGWPMRSRATQCLGALIFQHRNDR